MHPQKCTTIRSTSYTKFLPGTVTSSRWNGQLNIVVRELRYDVPQAPPWLGMFLSIHTRTRSNHPSTNPDSNISKGKIFRKS